MSASAKKKPDPTKPPLGIKPRWLCLEQREGEIRAAIDRYNIAYLPIPPEWISELNELVNYRNNL